MNLLLPDHPTGYLGVEEAANFLATTPKGIYALVSRREIPYRRLGRRLLFDPSELRDYLDKTLVPPLDASGVDRG